MQWWGIHASVLGRGANDGSQPRVGNSYRYGVTATDCARNTSGVAFGPPADRHRRVRRAHLAVLRPYAVRRTELQDRRGCGRELGGGLFRWVRLALPAFGGKWRA